MTGKVYDPCELARELRYKHKIPLKQIPTWVCIAEKESNFDTQAIGTLNTDGSKDHGIFQINDRYWCDVGPKEGCGVSCETLRTDMNEMMKCVKKVYKVHGFSGWTTYGKCKKPASISHCWKRD